MIEKSLQNSQVERSMALSTCQQWVTAEISSCGAVDTRGVIGRRNRRASDITVENMMRAN